MRDNRLLRLPQELGVLSRLQVLDVSGNRYCALPKKKWRERGEGTISTENTAVEKTKAL